MLDAVANLSLGQDSVVFETECLDAYAESVRQLLPAQTVTLLRTIQGVLAPLISHDAGSRKKQKLDTTTSFTQNGNRVNTSPDLPITLLTSTLRNATTSIASLPAVTKIADSLFTDFIQICIGKRNGNKRKNEGDGGEMNLTIAALELHLALMETVDGYWSQNVSSAGILSLLTIPHDNIRVRYLKVKTTVFVDVINLQLTNTTFLE